MYHFPDEGNANRDAAKPSELTRITLYIGCLAFESGYALNVQHAGVQAIDEAWTRALLGSLF